MLEFRAATIVAGGKKNRIATALFSHPRMFFSVENESSREDIFTLQQTLEKHRSSNKLCVNWFTSQKAWSCLHPLASYFVWNHWEVTAKKSSELTGSSDVAPTLAVVWHGWCEGSAKLLGSPSLSLEETGANPQQRLFVPGPFAAQPQPALQSHGVSDREGLIPWLGLSSVRCSQGRELLLEVKTLTYHSFASSYWEVFCHRWKELIRELASWLGKIINYDGEKAAVYHLRIWPLTYIYFVSYFGV